MLGVTIICLITDAYLFLYFSCWTKVAVIWLQYLQMLQCLDSKHFLKNALRHHTMTNQYLLQQKPGITWEHRYRIFIWFRECESFLMGRGKTLCFTEHCSQSYFRSWVNLENLIVAVIKVKWRKSSLVLTFAILGHNALWISAFWFVKH